MATDISKLKWAWQAQCLSHTLLILKNCTTFIDVRLMLKLFFDISTGFRFSKMQSQCGSVPSIPVAVLDLLYIDTYYILLLVIIKETYKVVEIIQLTLQLRNHTTVQKKKQMGQPKDNSHKHEKYAGDKNSLLHIRFNSICLIIIKSLYFM